MKLLIFYSYCNCKKYNKQPFKNNYELSGVPRFSSINAMIEIGKNIKKIKIFILKYI